MDRGVFRDYVVVGGSGRLLLVERLHAEEDLLAALYEQRSFGVLVGVLAGEGGGLKAASGHGGDHFLGAVLDLDDGYRVSDGLILLEFSLVAAHRRGWRIR